MILIPNLMFQTSVQGLLSSFHGIDFDPSQLASLKVYYRNFMQSEIAEEASISVRYFLIHWLNAVVIFF